MPWLCVLGLIWPQQARSQTSPRPAPPSARAAALARRLDAAACAPCHQAIYDEWRSSGHAVALVNSPFLASFRREPQAWCSECHGPLIAQRAALLATTERDLLEELRAQLEPEPLTAEGVNCAACHQRDGVLLAAQEPTAAALRAHPIVAEPKLHSADFCGSCHQVNWPTSRSPLRLGTLAMQDTLGEFVRAGAPGERCQSCHMAQGTHRFAGGRSRGLVQRTVAVRVWRPAPRRVAVELVARGAGHSVPTGDPFRRFTVRICADPRCSEPLATAVFGRRFGGQGGRVYLVEDTSVPPPSGDAPLPAARRQLSLELPAEAGARLWFKLSYRYVAPSTESDLSETDVEAILREGEILQQAP